MSLRIRKEESDYLDYKDQQEQEQKQEALVHRVLAKKDELIFGSFLRVV